MRSTKRVLLIAIFAILGLIAGGFAPADAGTCAASTTCTFELTVSNVTQLTPIDVRVTWTNTATTTTFSVQWISGGPGTPKFIEEFGYNSSVAVTSISGGGNFADWTAKSNSQIDGFGKFATDEAHAPPGTFGITSPIVFTLASLVTSIPKNEDGTEFVAHVGGYGNGCSGFVGEAGSTPGTTSDPRCGATVAEPGTVGTLALLGFGLVSAGALLRRRWFRHEV